MSAIDDCSQIIIREEEDNKFIIKVKGRNRNIFGNEVSSAFADLSIEEKIVVIVKRYLNSFKINGVTRLLPVVKTRNKDAVVYAENGNKELRMYIYNSKFKFLSSIIMNKYLADRYDILFGTDFKMLEIVNSEECSKFDFLDDRVRLALMTGDNILLSEREFLKELLYCKFSQIGELAVIDEIYSEGKVKTPVGYVITCGDFKITFAKNYKNSLILGIIREYNNELKEKMKIKKGK